MYAGLWLFGANDSHFPGATVFTQAPMGAFQIHLSYNLRPQLWTALDATYYVGGRATRQGVPDLHMQSNSRVGATLVLPVGRRHSVKLAASRGATIRYGPDFSTVSIGWQTAWVQHAARTDSVAVPQRHLLAKSPIKSAATTCPRKSPGHTAVRE